MNKETGKRENIFMGKESVGLTICTFGLFLKMHAI